MKAAFISRSGNEARFSIEFTEEEFANAAIGVYKSSKHKFMIPGFRKGKAPKKLIEAHYGEGVFFEDAVNQLLTTGYPDALDELGLNVVAQPNAEFSELEQGKGFSVDFTVEVYPELDIVDYKNVKIYKIEAEVSDEDVNRELESLQKRNARIVAVSRPAREGDMVLLDYKGFVGDEQFEGGTAERQALKLGSGSFIPGFEEQLTGASPGDELDVFVEFPIDYHAEDLAGNKAVFKCKVHEVKEEELPELDDDFAKDVSEHDTLEELTSEIRARLTKSSEAAAENRMRNSLVEKICGSNDIDIPNQMIEDEVSDMLEEFDHQLQYQGMSLEKYYEITQKDEEDVKGELREEASKRVKTRIVLTRVAEQEGLEATEDEIEQEAGRLSEQTRVDTEKIMEMIGSGKASYIKKDIQMKKAVEFIFQNAAIE